MNLFIRLKIAAVAASIVLAVIGYLVNLPVLEFFGILGAVFSFGLLIAQVLLDDAPPRGRARRG
jgi:hypothetical protein